MLKGHKGAVLQVLWPTDLCVVSCSADKSVACWDPNKGVRTRKLLEHTAIVNSCAVAADAPHLVASGSDDCTVILWVTDRLPENTSQAHIDRISLLPCL